MEFEYKENIPYITETNRIKEKENPNNSKSYLLATENKKLIDTDMKNDYNTKNNKCFNLLLLGGRKVGKTGFVNRVCDDIFNKNYTETICCDKRVKNIKFNENDVFKINFYELGKFDFESNKQTLIEYLKIAHCCIFVFAADDLVISDIEKYFTLLSQNNDTLYYLIINKIDFTRNAKFDSLYLKTNTDKLLNQFKDKEIIINKIFETSCIDENKETISSAWMDILKSLLETEVYNNGIKNEIWNQKSKLSDKFLTFKYNLPNKKKCCEC